MWWLEDVVVRRCIFVIYCFVVCVDFRTWMLTRKTSAQRKTSMTAARTRSESAEVCREPRRYVESHVGLDAQVAEIMHRRGTSWPTRLRRGVRETLRRERSRSSW